MNATQKREIVEQIVSDLSTPKSVRTDSGEVEQHDILAKKKVAEWAMQELEAIDLEENGKRGIILGQIRNVDSF